MKWINKKKIIIEKLKEYGYVENTYDTLTKEVEDSPMVAVVNLKVQPKPGEHIPIYFVDPMNLDEGESYKDINGVLESTKQIIRNAINTKEKSTGVPHEPNATPKSIEPKTPLEPDTTEQETPSMKPMTTNKTLQPIPENNMELSVDVIQQYINPDLNAEQAYRFMQLCQASNLNPFLYEAHAIVIKGKATFVVGVGGNIKRAQEQDDYDGYQSGVIVQIDENTVEDRDGSFVLKSDKLVGGWCKVWRKGINQEFLVRVSMDEYVQMKDGHPNKIWTSKPGTMITKVAESQCHRKAYMGINSGLYGQEEMQDLGDVELIK